VAGNQDKHPVFKILKPFSFVIGAGSKLSRVAVPFKLCEASGLYYKSFTIVSYDRNDSVQCYETFYRRKLRNFAMS
jgi:hypothetical protein